MGEGLSYRDSKPRPPREGELPYGQTNSIEALADYFGVSDEWMRFQLTDLTSDDFWWFLKADLT